MKNYYKIMLGRRSMYADQCLEGSFIGADYGFDFDLTEDLTEDARDFNHKFIPVYLSARPGKTRVAAGLACATIWTICKGIEVGDVVLSPNGHGSFLVGEVVSDYQYVPNDPIPHRRSVNWFPTTIKRSELSEALRNSTNSQGTSIQITKHAEEIESYLRSYRTTTPKVVIEDVEDLATFGLEKHLEDFLVDNWENTELGKRYDIYEVEGERVGQQYPSDTGPIDILAISKDKKELLIVELKRGRVSDKVIGQIQRYMGYVKEELAEPDQIVKGVIIGLEDDIRIRRALAVTSNIEFYQYQVSFKLTKTK